MKKLLSVILAAMMAVSVFAVSLIPAMAEDTVNSPTASTAAPTGPTLEVNGVPTDKDITYTKDENNHSYTFNYVGGGLLLGWEENCKDLGLVEGVDYTAVENADGSFTITLISAKAQNYWDTNKIIVDALVDEGESTTATTATTSKNDSSKAPATGMSSSVLAGSVAVACAGIAVLAATKKKFSE